MCRSSARHWFQTSITEKVMRDSHSSLLSSETIKFTLVRDKNPRKINQFMSEYMEIETEIDDDDLTMHISTNLKLADGKPEEYDSLEALEEGSPVAQALAMIDGIAHLTIDGKNMITGARPRSTLAQPRWRYFAALKDFFL